MSSTTPLLYDWTGIPVASGYAPVTSRPATALNSTAQGGIVTLGSDYGTTPKAQSPKVDQFGTQYVAVSNPAGGTSQVYTGQTSAVATAQYGNLCMVRQDSPTPSSYQTLLADPAGNLYTHARSKATFRAIITRVATAANRYLAVLLNASTGTMVLRLTEVTIYVPPGGYAGGLLGASAATYYPLLCEFYRVATTAVTGGTAITSSACDTSDTLATGASVVSLPTVSSTMAKLFRADAVASTGTGENFYQRDDPNNKAIVIRPGEGLAIFCESSGTVTAPGGGTVNNVAVDISIVFTQAVA